MAITLQEAKEYLRVGYDDDNDYITELIDISEAYIDGCVGTAYREKDKYNSEEEYKRGCRLATLLQKKVISDMYDVSAITNVQNWGQQIYTEATTYIQNTITSVCFQTTRAIITK